MKKKQPKQGIIAKRPWLLVIAAFTLMFTAWGVMFFIASKHQPVVVPFAPVSHATH